MVRTRLSRWLRPLCGGAALAALTVASCSVPDFEFEQRPALGVSGSGSTIIDHCVNGLRDSELGEADYDCGGGCPPCNVGQHCATVADCVEGICSEGTCLAEGCINGVQDGSETDLDCGGGGCNACFTGQKCGQDADCDSGVCSDAKCMAAACDDQVENGKETALDCGGDCPPCSVNQPCLAGRDCASGVCNGNLCGPTCPDGFSDCDKKNDNACEISTRGDLMNCGTCGNVCDLPHATAECSAGDCRIVTEGCEAGWEDCNGLPQDGCEVNLGTDKGNCGACNKVCPEVNGAPFCAVGACQITCSTGFDDCDDNRDNGCEKAVSTDVNNCGECGKKCTPQSGGTAYCKDDACGETICPTGLGDCNGEPSDGCEVDLRTDTNNCSSCGNLCLAANGTATCNSRVCGIADCDPGFENCTGGYADGCETNTNTSTSHCGGCGDACTIENGTPKCAMGSCQVNSCGGTFRDCDSNPATGCEINIASHPSNCGGCGVAGSNCNTKYDNASSTCSNSACSNPTCDAGYGDCMPVDFNCETDTTSSESHCGACSKACEVSNASSNNCSNSMCSPVCVGKYLTCDNDKFNGCEANSADDEDHCGGCNLTCNSGPSAHVTSNDCVGSSCNPQCSGSYRSCDSDKNNGCETNTATSGSHCGACNQVCRTDAAAHVASNSCSGSSCQPACSGLFDDCDSMPANGCETAVGDDEQNCGGCDVVCGTANASGTNCAAGTCDPVCNAGFRDCSNSQLGCTTQLGTTSNCTACGQSCSGATPFCNAGSGCAAFRDIVVAGSGVRGIAGYNGSATATDVLTVSHTLSSGSGNARMVLVGIAASEEFLDPETVTYDGTSMIRAVQAQNSTNQSYAAIYYLLDTALPAAANTTSPVSAVFSSTFAWGHGGLDVLELRNAMQTAPLTTGSSSGAACSGSATRGVSATYNQTGSLVYGLLSGRGATAASLNGAPGLTQTWNQHQATPSDLTGSAAYVIDNDDRTINWSLSNCFNSAAAMVVIKRLSAM